MQVFRKIVLPIAFLLVLALIGTALLLMALQSNSQAEDSDLMPTGALPPANSAVQRGSIDATLSLDGTVQLDAPTEVKSPVAGRVNFVHVGSGATVERGAPLFQVEYTVPGPGAGAGEDGADVLDAGGATSYVDVRAPVSGVLGSFAVSVGDAVDKGGKVTEIKSTVYRVKATVEPVKLYQLDPLPGEAEIVIERGPEPFMCKTLTLSESALSSTATKKPAQESQEDFGDGAQSSSADDSSISCTVPNDVKVFHGLKAKMRISTGSVTDVLTVPVTAVQGLGDGGRVWVVGESGEGEETPVKLGLTDGVMIEVREGLEEGQPILEFVPGTEPTDDFGDFGDFGESGGSVSF